MVDFSSKVTKYGKNILMVQTFFSLAGGMQVQMVTGMKGGKFRNEEGSNLTDVSLCMGDKNLSGVAGLHD